MVWSVLERWKSSTTQCPTIWTIVKNFHLWGRSCLLLRIRKKHIRSSRSVKNSGSCIIIEKIMNTLSTSQKLNHIKKRSWLQHNGHPPELIEKLPDYYSRDYTSGNRRNVCKIISAAAGIGKQKGSDSLTRQRPTPWLVSKNWTNLGPKFYQTSFQESRQLCQQQYIVYSI